MRLDYLQSALLSTAMHAHDHVDPPVSPAGRLVRRLYMILIFVCCSAQMKSCSTAASSAYMLFVPKQVISL